MEFSPCPHKPSRLWIQFIKMHVVLHEDRQFSVIIILLFIKWNHSLLLCCYCTGLEQQLDDVMILVIIIITIIIIIIIKLIIGEILHKFKLNLQYPICIFRDINEVLSVMWVCRVEFVYLGCTQVRFLMALVVWHLDLGTCRCPFLPCSRTVKGMFVFLIPPLSR